MNKEIKRLAVLGSTGSVGRQALDVVRSLPDRFKIVALAAGSNIALLEEQINEFKPELVYYQSQKSKLRGSFKQVSMEEMVQFPQVDRVLIATSGKAGLSPTLAAVRAGKKVALSNKEALVMAGEIVIREAKANSAEILPVDSEHSAVWQCLTCEKQKATRIILTASGGPFLHYTLDQMAGVTVEQALNHPSWRMGKKITIDSATLMNKGLEVIEAHWLFDMPYDKISIVMHPQSFVHSMVEFVDMVIKAQLSYPDMRLPIQYALGYPERLPNSSLPKLDLTKISSLVFEQPDLNRFPCLKIAMEVGRMGGTYPTVLCAADEVAVDLFLSRRIKFTDIAGLVERVLEQHQPVHNPTLDDIMAADIWAREAALSLMAGIHTC